MGSVRRYWWLLLFALVITAVVCAPSGERSSAATRLEIESFGGFAYVPSSVDNQLEIGFLRTSSAEGCNVPQLGVDLLVVEGNVTAAPPTPTPNKFDVSNAVITFPALEGASGVLTANRGGRPPDRPTNPNAPSEWENLRYVPDVNKELTTPGSLNPNWRTMVDGRLVVKGGTLKGLPPSLAGVRNRVFEFRNADNSRRFTQAVTDMTHYTVQIPANEVVIRLQAASGTQEIRVAPRNPGRPVKLRLMGRHDESSDIRDDQQIHHFCAFYQLLQPIPPQNLWLLPRLVPATASGGVGQPSPGRFCPGDIFMS